MCLCYELTWRCTYKNMLHVVLKQAENEEYRMDIKIAIRLTNSPRKLKQVVLTFHIIAPFIISPIYGVQI